MKTKKTIRTLALMALMILTISVYADGKNTTKDSSKLKTDNSKILLNNSNQKANINFDASIFSIEESEKELKVENYKPLNEIIPSWMFVDDEPELEVVDLRLKK